MDNFIDELQAISLSVIAISCFLSSIDVSSDFGQGYLLYQDPDLRNYGILMFVINWMPGLVASVHLITNQRNNLGPCKTFLWCSEYNGIIYDLKAARSQIHRL